MAVETEKKYRLDKRSLVEFTARLAELGATFSNERFEDNYLYRNGSVDVSSSVLRIRKIAGTTFLTYKERMKSDSDFKTKIEHETLVSDAVETEQIVAKLGYKLAVVYEKHRKTWHFCKCEVVLDELPFGQFMEIEGEPDEILKVEKLLGAEELDVETRGYSRLTTKFGQLVDGVYEARFDHPRASA